MKAIAVATMFALLGAPASAGEFHAATTAGRPVRITTQSSWHHDCSPDTPPQVAVQQAPAGGSVFLQPSTTTIRTAEAGGEQCIGRPARGVGVYYRPQPGFRGSDQFSFAVSFPNGVVLNDRATVTVR